MARILLIEDDPVAAEVLHTMLLRMGHEVELARDGVEGVARFCEQRHELVICDLILPRKEGLDALLEIRRLEPTAKLIAISGGSALRSAEGGLAIAQRMGADAILPKPFTVAELEAAIASLMGPPGEDPTEPAASSCEVS